MKSQSGKLRLSATDLSNFLGCRHLSSLDAAAAKGEHKRPGRYGPMIDELRERGLAHEQRYLAHLQSLGLSVVDLTSAGDAVAATLEAIRSGADVIYQPALADGDWSGRADFLRKVAVPSNLGDWSYEVIDTKLARETRGGTVLQLCVYAHLLERLQGMRPENVHVVSPAEDGFAEQAYRTDDYAAYFRYIRRDFSNFVSALPATYPEKVSQCDFCVWWDQCEARRRADDHLCYVAGLGRGQIATLRELGIHTLSDFAQLAELPKPPRGSVEALARARDQARIQFAGRNAGKPLHELKLPVDEEHGFLRLPEPTDDDIYLDFEGNHFAEAGPQEYLTGYVMRGPDGHDVYTALWATTAAEEQQAFRVFMQAAMAARARNAGAHIYHFAPYEPTALKRLMGRHGCCETQLDELLRGRAFVDLHGVVRRALIASVESYSIKELERFFDYTRAQDLREASLSRRVIEQVLEAGESAEAFTDHREIVEAYNREDCESAKRLHTWLEQLRTAAIEAGHDIPRPLPAASAPDEKTNKLDAELQALRDRLLAGIPDDPAERSAEDHARVVLAHMMEFHRREDKASFWEKYRLLDLELDAYEDERRAIVGLEYLDYTEVDGRSAWEYRYPPQDVDVRALDDLYAPNGDRIGRVAAVNPAEGTMALFKSKKAAGLHPAEVIVHNHVPTDVLRGSLIDFGNYVLRCGFAPQAPYAAAVAMLLRHAPAGAALANDAMPSLQHPGESTVAAACRIAAGLDGCVLAIQGPPGTGKTYTGAHIICELVRRGLKVGVTAVSHKVVLNILEGAVKESRKQDLELRVLHKQRGMYEGEYGIQYAEDYEPVINALAAHGVDVVGGTAWQWARADFRQSVDVLIVDEAGQMSLANVLAVASAARSLVLLGDPQQLEQPLQGSHPEGSEVSALEHWLGSADTMPADRGLFLAETYRLHPDICRFNSEVYYEGRLKSVAGLERQRIDSRDGSALQFTGSGLRYFEVKHTGNQARSPEEAEAIRDLVDELLAHGQWTDRDGKIHPITINDILIVAPYNLQVAALIAAMPALRQRIGTVDRFQGQEAAVVIYSMTSSSPDEVPRGMEFLYDPHRFNVATSRARAMCILVGDPSLFEPECTRPKQMKMANGFCRYLELCG